MYVKLGQVAIKVAMRHFCKTEVTLVMSVLRATTTTTTMTRPKTAYATSK